MPALGSPPAKTDPFWNSPPPPPVFAPSNTSPVSPPGPKKIHRSPSPSFSGVKICLASGVKPGGSILALENRVFFPFTGIEGNKVLFFRGGGRGRSPWSPGEPPPPPPLSRPMVNGFFHRPPFWGPPKATFRTFLPFFRCRRFFFCCPLLGPWVCWNVMLPDFFHFRFP